MKTRARVLSLVLGCCASLGLVSVAPGQETLFSLPSPEASLQPLTDPFMIDAAIANAAVVADGTPSLLTLPTAPVIPNAVSRFSPQRRVAQLRRGDTTIEISNEAFRASGVLDHAVRKTPELARSYQIFEARTLQRQQVEFQQQTAPSPQKADAMGLAVSEAQVAQQSAAQAFEDTLWNYGFNGAKVASVTSTGSNRRQSTHYVLLDAIGTSNTDNLGYAITSISQTGGFGWTYVPSEYLLQLPVDPNDVFYSPLFSAGSQRTPDGVMIMLSDDKASNPVVQMLGAPRFGYQYDTGIVADGTTSFAERVDLNSRRAPGAGQTSFVQEGDLTLPVDLGLNAQILDLGGGTTGQFFITANNDRDLSVLDVETLGVRAYNRRRGSFFEGWSLVAGAKQTLFGAVELAPQGLENNRVLAGTVDGRNGQRQRAQVAIHAPLTNNWMLKMAVEDPDQQDLKFVSGPTFTKLERWPTLASNLTWKAPETDDQFVLGGLVRNLGYQVNATGREEFETGWGLSAILKVNSGTGSNFIGVAGGNGVGDYIRGVSASAVGDTNSIDVLNGIGAFVGRHHVFMDQCNNPISELNFAYGYGYMETPATLAATTDGKLHHCWANYVHFLGDRIGVGVEYQYGYRQVASGDVGENHRMLFMLAMRTGKVQKSTRVNEMLVGTPLPPELPPELPDSDGTESQPLPAPMSSERGTVYQTSPIGATLGDQGLQSVVRQSQLGGPAFRQSL
ncbi:hypothetical protein Enr13x_48700 [Stieleria neptunia]|uniref:Uncharacterized protein n=1 Tax=Stieleria neptunia TaxID=2527979 RepID=A0A518HW12_9BACT|nr:hypothetical protein [Stieleria neptunia]QDV44997.1 hypothetical protein Enr13x_48700 [Stieleria neptunia]